MKTKNQSWTEGQDVVIIDGDRITPGKITSISGTYIDVQILGNRRNWGFTLDGKGYGKFTKNTTIEPLTGQHLERIKEKEKERQQKMLAEIARKGRPEYKLLQLICATIEHNIEKLEVLPLHKILEACKALEIDTDLTP
jgi:hypothetical protein